MSIDLDDIERRIADGIYGDDRMTKEGRNDAFSALNEIIAEVNRLRAEVDAERAAVVAYLRKRHADTQESDGFEDMYDNAVSCTYRRAADFIERGEHRREE